MGRVLDHLTLIGDIKPDESDDLLSVGMAAALLHDIGQALFLTLLRNSLTSIMNKSDIK
jgi:hypothetical protein